MRVRLVVLLTIFGVAAAATMVTAYALERRGSEWIAIFAIGCFGTALYGILSEAWIFAVLETVWGAIALRRFFMVRKSLDLELA